MRLKRQNLLPSGETDIERLSEYMESSGKGYKNHAATIRRWANADKKKEEPSARCVCRGIDSRYRSKKPLIVTTNLKLPVRISGRKEPGRPKRRRRRL